MNELIMPHNIGVKNALENMKEVLALYKKVIGNYRPLLDGERYSVMMAWYLIYYWVARCFIVKVIWRGFWKVAIIRHINDRGKEEPSAVCMLDYNAERRMTDYR